MKQEIQNKQMVSSINEALFGEYMQEWYMTEAERCTLIMLLQQIQPECSLEIGTYRGGSLSVLSRFSRHVYTLDIDPTCRDLHGARFQNVDFVIGPSRKTLPPLLERLQASRARLEFILIDGDHSRDGVRSDVEIVLRLKPIRPLFIVMHDSFNPACRQGIAEAPWASNPHVHFVELDFVPGRFISDRSKLYREMWCGFALALLLPDERAGALTIHRNEELMFQRVWEQSVHRYDSYPKWHPRCVFGSLRRRMKQATGTW